MSTVFDEVREANEAFFSLLEDPSTRKEAADIGSKEITRLLIREEEFSSKILPPKEVNDSELVVQLDSDQPVVYQWFETSVPQALNVGFRMNPDDYELHVNRVPVTGQMIISPRIYKYEQELRIYPFDVKQMFADNIVKDLGYAVDRSVIAGVDNLLVGAGSNMAWSGSPQWTVASGGWTRNNIVEGLKTLPKTQRSLKPELCLANTVTLMDFVKYTRDTAGGDMSEDMLKKGFTEKEMFGVKWLGTIKRYLIGDGTFYQFAAPKFLGVYRIFQQPQMYIEFKNHKYMFFCDKMLGVNLINHGGIARTDVTA